MPSIQTSTIALQPGGPVVRRPRCNDTAFVDLLAAYRDSGGLARSSDLPFLLRGDARRHTRTIAALVDGGQVVHLEWGDACWLPLFQFCRPGLKTLPELPRVMGALAPALDSWGMALWFSRPSAWLAGARPADLAATNGVRVVQAAMADGLAFAS
ncbi:hypothetical protein QTH87_26045 [Variovorax sp. J22P168]|uniref:hypothetical protein n=1 Tax=Variovorax jilinensis TaxID=3053513 RepID=UPI002576513B|nr:hypothetical protein [Variovorax sp. J22P168]MDM0015929.1 hypothetical protein [Variovorax sp. J22P168]